MTVDSESNVILLTRLSHAVFGKVQKNLGLVGSTITLNIMFNF